MTFQEILTALTKNFIAGMAMYGVSMSLAYGGYVGQDYSDWCDPRFCCPPKPETLNASE